jgi:LmbE family N-acetylglucosaminyl deacetylase
MLDLRIKGPVLLLGPHPDDEIGCAGLVRRLVDGGYDVHHFFFSDCRESIGRANATVEQLLDECEQSRDVLGIRLENRHRLDFPVRYFPQHRQEILEELVAMRGQFNPGLVLVPNGFDIHQDHVTVHQEAVRAFKHSTILGYELPWNTLEMSHDCFVNLTEEQVAAKMKALSCYASQSGRTYANAEFFQALLRMRGVQSNMRYAECFEVIRLIL